MLDNAEIVQDYCCWVNKELACSDCCWFTECYDLSYDRYDITRRIDESSDNLSVSNDNGMF